MSEQPEKRARWRVLATWLLVALYAGFALPALATQLGTAGQYLASDADARESIRIGGVREDVQTIVAGLPPGEPLLIQKQQGRALLMYERVFQYWLFPRPVYSTFALERAGVDVDRFARERGIGWVWRGGQLLRIDGKEQPAPMPDAESGDGASTVQLWTSRPSHPVRVGIGIAASLALFWAVGALLLAFSGIGPVLSGRAERGAVAFLLGTAAVAAWSLAAFLAGLGVRPWTVALPVVPLVVLAVRRRRSEGGLGLHAALRPDSDATRPSASDRIALALAAVLVIAFVFKAVAEPMNGADDRFHWAHKALVMVHEASVANPYFQEPFTVHPRPSYPLIVPSAEAVVSLFAGGFDDQYFKILFPLAFAAVLVVFFSSLRAFGVRSGAGAATLALALVPFYSGRGLVRDWAAAFSGYPDVVLAAFLTCAVLFFARARKFRESRFDALAACFLVATYLSKWEGKVLALLALAVGGLWLFLRRTEHPRGTRSLLAYAGALVLMIAHEFAFTLRVQSGTHGDDYSQLLTMERLSESLGRAPGLLVAMAQDAVASPRLGFMGLVLVAAWVSACLPGRRRLARPEVFVPLVFTTLAIGFYFVPFLVGPEPWSVFYSWAGARLFSQLLPLTLWVAFLLLLGRRGVDTPTTGACAERAR